MSDTVTIAHRPRRGKYLAIAAVAARQTLSQRGDLAARVIFYYAILFVFSHLWRVVLTLDTTLAYSEAQMLWYLALTEWVILSLPELHIRMEKDVRTGDVAYGLPKPISYFWSRMAEGSGAHVVRLIVVGVAGLGGATLLVGLPPDASALAMALGAGVLASTIGLLFVGLIGLSGVWLHDVTPAYWIWQKLTFVLGGLILPMEIYPPWLQRIAECTPFHAMLYSVGRWMLDFDAVTAARSSALQLGWIVLLLGVCAWASARAMHRIERRGE